MRDDEIRKVLGEVAALYQRLGLPELKPASLQVRVNEISEGSARLLEIARRREQQ